MKHTLLIVSLFATLTASATAADPVVVITSASSITVDGVPFGKPCDAIANNRALAPAIQRALEAWDAQRAEALAKAMADAHAAKVAAEAESTRMLAVIESAKARATTAPGKALIDGLVTEAKKPEKARQKASIEAEIAAKQAELAKLNGNP